MEYHLLKLIPKATPISKVKSRERARLLFIGKRAVLEVVSNKNTPLKSMKGTQWVHLEPTQCCLSIDTFFLSCSVAQFVDIVKLHSLWTGTSALSATLMRYYAVYQFSYVMCRTRDSVFITYQTPRRELIKLFFGKYF